MRTQGLDREGIPPEGKESFRIRHPNRALARDVPTAKVRGARLRDDRVTDLADHGGVHRDAVESVRPEILDELSSRLLESPVREGFDPASFALVGDAVPLAVGRDPLGDLDGIIDAVSGCSRSAQGRQREGGR